MVRESERQERWATMHNTRSLSTDVTCFFFCLPVALSVDVNMSWTCSLSPTGLTHYFIYNRGVFVLFLCFLYTHLAETRILLLNSTNQLGYFSSNKAFKMLLKCEYSLGVLAVVRGVC